MSIIRDVATEAQWAKSRPQWEGEDHLGLTMRFFDRCARHLEPPSSGPPHTRLTRVPPPVRRRMCVTFAVYENIVEYSRAKCLFGKLNNKTAGVFMLSILAAI